MNNPDLTSDSVPFSSLLRDTSAIPVSSNNGNQLAETEHVSTPMSQKRGRIVSTTPKLTIAHFSGVTLDDFVVDPYEVNFKTDKRPVQTNMVAKVCVHDVKDISVRIRRNLCGLFKVSGYRNEKKT